MPGTRMFFCDPFGRTDVDALFNHGRDDLIENDYVFMHDQEPIHMDLHQNLFDEVIVRCTDIFQRTEDPTWTDSDLGKWAGFYSIKHGPINLSIHGGREEKPNLSLQELIRQGYVKNKIGHIVTSEKGEFVKHLSDTYGWQTHYYFFHGWASMDWYRGYDRTFLIPRARDRNPTKTYISPNRIIAGKRDHRVLFLYHIFKNHLDDNWLSAPRVCAYENIDILKIAHRYTNTYPDILQVLEQAPLPKLFPGEDVQPMTSCWLTNFAESSDSLLYVPTETVYFGARSHITEKTFKAIALEMPFVLVAPAGSLAYMRAYGFRTFGDVIDESYDEETDDMRRLEKIAKLLRDLNQLTISERQQLHRAMLPAVEHNFNHFYRGGLAEILWQELMGMLNGLRSAVRR